MNQTYNNNKEAHHTNSSKQLKLMVKVIIFAHIRNILGPMNVEGGWSQREEEGETVLRFGFAEVKDMDTSWVSGP